MSDDNLHAVITLREVYDAVVELKQELNAVPRMVIDHEERIRDLERKIWGFSGLAAIIGAALAQVVAFMIRQ
jgi:hypothetical protein